MPIVHIDLIEGRDPARIEAMIGAVSRAIADSLDAPISSVRIVVNEMAPHQFGVGGEPWPVVAARRRAQQQQQTTLDTAQHHASQDPASQNQASQHQASPPSPAPEGNHP